WTEQKYFHLPFFSATVTVFLPWNEVAVSVFSNLPPVSRSRVKLWIGDLSVTTKVYFPALSVVTFFVPFFSVIVKPGPTVPMSFGVVIAQAGTRNTAAATTPRVNKPVKRVMES